MSAIAKTASITLLTGVPGNGKTLRAVWYMQQAVKAHEAVFCCNLNGINIREVVDFADPTKWEELPTGSILVVDEAQKFFRAAGGSVPEYIKAMEEIRHRGIRLILITQHPALIHSNIRALVGLHEHLVRENGKQSAVVYRRSRVIDNVRSDKALAVEDHETWAYPAHCFELYKSAEVHTVKRTVPSKYKRAMIMAVVAVGVLGYCIWAIKSAVLSGSTPETSSHSATRGAPGLFGSGDPAKPPKYANATEYAKAHLPRFGSMPWTAPVFDERNVTADPMIYCASSLPGFMADGSYNDQATCTCYTEQATVYELSQPECRTVARAGPIYNPYKQRDGMQHGEGVQGLPPAAMAAPAAAPVSGTVIPGAVTAVHGSGPGFSPDSAP